MRSIAEKVKHIIETRPFLHEGLSRGIINHAALAEEIRPLVEREVRKSVTFSAVNMAIRRGSQRIQDSTRTQAHFDTNCDITLKSDLVAVAVNKQEYLHRRLQKLYGELDFGRGDFLTITQGIHEMLIITNERYTERLQKLMGDDIIYSSQNLATLTIRIPRDAVDQPGLFYVASRALAWEDINIVDIVSTYTELTFVFHENDVVAAFNCLKELIRRDQEDKETA